MDIKAIRVNQPVVTPIGEGVFQGKIDGPEPEDVRALVRVKLNPQSIPCLQMGNCLTPHATMSGLWIFRISELR